MNGSINFDGTLSGSIAGGGGGGGSEVTITPVLTVGTKIADYSIDSATGSLYAPEAGDTVEVTPTLNVGDKVADIEVNGVNKALYSQSYGYANDMHDTNSETIGGLQKGSNITPIMVKAVSYADQSGVDGETIGVLSVGDTDYTVKQKKAKVINYSLTEQDTGKKWVDGKTIYQRTVYATAQTYLTNSAWSTIPWNSDFNNVAYLIEAMQHGVSPNAYQQIRFIADSGTIKAAAAVSDSYPPTLASNQYVTFYYTKTE